MKNLKKFNESTFNKLKEHGEFLVNKIVYDYKQREDTVGRPILTYKELTRSVDTYDVVSQYGDFFIIMPTNIKSTDLPLIDLLLNRPYSGNMYTSRQDNRIQIRISGYDVEKMYKDENKEV
jgi:hypothetical protein